MVEIPFELTIQGTSISLTTVGVVVFAFIYSYVFWLISRSKQSRSNIFDVVLLGLLFAFICARLLSVLINLSQYSADPMQILNIFDRNFIYIGIFLGLILSTFFIFSVSSKEKDFHFFLEKTTVSYALAIIPLLFLATLAGAMPGIEVNGGLALGYADGSSRMPVNLFRGAYNLIFLLIWIIAARSAKKHGLFAAVYLMVFAAIEFILRIFSASYQPNLFNSIDLQQAVSVLIMLSGIFLMMDYYNIKFFSKKKKGIPVEEIPVRRKSEELGYPLRRMKALESRERFSMSYSTMEEGEVSELSFKERLRIFLNSFKRRYRK